MWFESHCKDTWFFKTYIDVIHQNKACLQVLNQYCIRSDYISSWCWCWISDIRRRQSALSMTPIQPKSGHVMLSYSWYNQKTVLEVCYSCYVYKYYYIRISIISNDLIIRFYPESHPRLSSVVYLSSQFLTKCPEPIGWCKWHSPGTSRVNYMLLHDRDKRGSTSTRFYWELLVAWTVSFIYGKMANRSMGIYHNKTNIKYTGQSKMCELLNICSLRQDIISQ